MALGGGVGSAVCGSAGWQCVVVVRACWMWGSAQRLPAAGGAQQGARSLTHAESESASECWVCAAVRVCVCVTFPPAPPPAVSFSGSVQAAPSAGRATDRAPPAVASSTGDGGRCGRETPRTVRATATTHTKHGCSPPGGDLGRQQLCWAGSEERWRARRARPRRARIHWLREVAAGGPAHPRTCVAAWRAPLEPV